MATVFEGSINGTVLSQAYDSPFIITYFEIRNTNAGTTIVNVTAIDDFNELGIVPQNLELSEGDLLWGDLAQRIIKSGAQIKVVTNGTVDYYFTIENMIAPQA